MKTVHFAIYLFTFILAACFAGTAKADLEDFVNAFNADGGVKMNFDRGGNRAGIANTAGSLGYTGTHYLGMSSDDAQKYLTQYNSPAIQGYVSNNANAKERCANVKSLRQFNESSATYFGTFCVEHSGSTGTKGNSNVYGTLNLTEKEDGSFCSMILSDSKTYPATALTMGAALLYRDYIMGINMTVDPWSNGGWFTVVAGNYDHKQLIDTSIETNAYRGDGAHRSSLWSIYDVQNMIWKLQDALYNKNVSDWTDVDALHALFGSNDVYYGHFMDYLNTFYGDYAGTYGANWWFSAYDPTSDFLRDQSVLVLNMYYEETGNGFQDHIILINRDGDLGGNEVPEPATIALLGLGLPAIALAARKRRRQA